MGIHAGICRGFALAGPAACRSIGIAQACNAGHVHPICWPRESGLQREFRSSLEARDGKNSCVACQEAGPAEAAHILRQHSSRSLHAPAGLLSAWDIRNGIMLCSVCRLYFDKFFWCVGADGKIVVSEALLSDGELCGHFAPLVDNKLRHAAGDVNWPCDLTWAHHRLLFEAARDELSRLNTCSKFACADCGAIFPSSLDASGEEGVSSQCVGGRGGPRRAATTLLGWRGGSYRECRGRAQRRLG